MFIYKDTLGNKVTVYFEAQENNPDDVLVIPKTEEGWLFTEHKIRGLEFPGGKGEPGETNIEAAKRELMEETGAISGELHFVADYLVESEERTFTKRVYVTQVISIKSLADYHETKGPVIIQGELNQFILQPAFSFFMRDAGMVRIVQQAERILNDKN
ncbi:nucleoside triphosphatase YtkD [Listeria monocytogenes]|uniref:Nucleoside triphosphatase YtkD n=1 Tax=Listeria monocytogenes TaxID=1639 RepID=A0A823IPF4_LISMN|nr:nucleoside triphosphatase YtkD [Listeria monocytogenes]EAC6871865.1 nucleoside triphosphatase YtkD [Listeria monocytogenes]EAC8432148.1 nucleoside triphosphatase YtkD [Listeria monocytogenes]EAD1932079.1 nucleoside triphosphatase YtkD [Listeria monocytogenes]EAE6661887.1 nucleoside triphosphatase YtkD [Listeria monocytogenes]EAF5833228.1 nucleoside triphosphatase YtkD [Listeria monocytogenes]